MVHSQVCHGTVHAPTEEYYTASMTDTIAGWFPMILMGIVVAMLSKKHAARANLSVQSVS